MPPPLQCRPVSEQPHVDAPIDRPRRRFWRTLLVVLAVVYAVWIVFLLALVLFTRSAEDAAGPAVITIPAEDALPVPRG